MQAPDARTTSTNMPAHWLPRHVPWTVAAHEVLAMRPDATPDRIYVPYDVAKRFEADLKQAPTQMERGTPAAIEASKRHLRSRLRSD